jgi:hypothetical protein
VTTVAKSRFELTATVSSENIAAVRPAIEDFVGRGGKIAKSDRGLEVSAVLEGESAKELNRALLSAMRKIEKRTRLRAQWRLGNTVESFFDYVPKGTRRLG